MTQFDWFLDEIRPTDKEAFLEHFQRSEIYENTLNIPFPYSEKDAEEWINLKAQETRENGTPVVFAIRDRSGRLIGSIGFDGLVVGRAHSAEIGYWLAKPYWNKGIMTSVVKELCRIAFNEFGLVRVQGRVFSSNPSSARVLEKCGFVQEGYLRKCEKKDGRYKDIRLYALINEQEQ